MSDHFTESELLKVDQSILESEIAKVGSQIDVLRVYESRLMDEYYCRLHKTRPGFEFTHKGGEYQVTTVSNFVLARKKTKSGEWARTERYCYGWDDWIRGKHNDPFNRMPFSL